MTVTRLRRTIQLSGVAALLIAGLTPGMARAADPITFGKADWPWWRGPNRDGIARSEPAPPLNWTPTKNIVWSAPVPGRGHSSPTVIGDQVVLATAHPKMKTQSVLCYDRQSGKKLWETVVHREGFPKKSNRRSSQASSTAACDDKRFFINFFYDGAVYTTALSRAGKILWQERITDYVVHQGYGSSPVVYRSLVIVSADNKSGGSLCALKRTNGEVVWRVDRPKTPNYPSPAIHNIAGRDQLFMSGCDLVSCFDPLSGKKLWEVEGATTECVSTIVTDGNHVFTSGGYPRNHVAAVKTDGSGEVVWQNSTRVYVPSMIAHGGYVYAVGDGGVAYCWKSSTGKPAWKHRIGGGFTSSPVMVGDLIYATNEAGKTTVFKASPLAFERVAESNLGGDVYELFSTPAICGGRIYIRVPEEKSGRRQETLYCIGE